MEEKKEPLIIECSACETRFRLWIPLKDASEWEKGISIKCIKCGRTYLVKKVAKGFDVEAVAEAPPQFETGAFAIDTNNDLSLLDHDVPEAGAGSTEKAETKASVSTILVVEDDALSRKMVENSLEDETNRLIIVKNGEEAMAALGKEKIDLLVVDLYLRSPNDPPSVMDGEEVLKKASAMVNIPAIVVTGKELVDDIALDPKWFEMHVKDFIQKGNPFWVDELKVKVKDIIAKR